MKIVEDSCGGFSDNEKNHFILKLLVDAQYVVEYILKCNLEIPERWYTRDFLYMKKPEKYYHKSEKKIYTGK
ncbi:hypothetical protein LBYZC6_38710 [Lacrimispora brassicae]